MPSDFVNTPILTCPATLLHIAEGIYFTIRAIIWAALEQKESSTGT